MNGLTLFLLLFLLLIFILIYYAYIHIYFPIAPLDNLILFNGQIYIFRPVTIYWVGERGLISGYPELISQVAPFIGVNSLNRDPSTTDKWALVLLSTNQNKGTLYNFTNKAFLFRNSTDSTGGVLFADIADKTLREDHLFNIISLGSNYYKIQDVTTSLYMTGTYDPGIASDIYLFNFVADEGNYSTFYMYQ